MRRRRAASKNDLKNNTESYTTKKAKRDDLQRRVEETKSFLQNEQNILDKCTELDAARMEIASLDGKMQMLEDKRQQCGKANRELIEAEGKQSGIEKRLDEIEARLVDKSRLESIVEGNTAEAELDEHEKKATETQELNNQKQALVSKFSIYEKDITTEIAIKVNRLDGCKKEAEMLNNANCIDSEKANCRFLQSAKEAKEKVGHLENQINEQQAYLARKQEEQNIAIAEIDEKIKSIAYDRITHSVLIQTVNEYRTAKDKLAKLAADAATAKELEKQEDELEGRVKELKESLRMLTSEIVVLQVETSNVDGLKARVADLARYEPMKEQLPKAKQFVESTEGNIAELSDDIKELSQHCIVINDRLNELALLTIDKGSLYMKKRDTEGQILTLEKSSLHIESADRHYQCKSQINRRQENTAYREAGTASAIGKTGGSTPGTCGCIQPGRNPISDHQGYSARTGGGGQRDPVTDDRWQDAARVCHRKGTQEQQGQRSGHTGDHHHGC